ncbi:MAG: cell division protein FtsL [Hydrogenophilales bacterium]|nr:cell division protein FtsL [Hydrogenophilales bacterium]
MLRLNIILALVLMTCALAVVSARHQARKSFIELQAEEKRTRDLDIEWGRLQLEQSTWAMHGRIEQVARDHLGMAIPSAERIQVLSPGTAQP